MITMIKITMIILPTERVKKVHFVHSTYQRLPALYQAHRGEHRHPQQTEPASPTAWHTAGSTTNRSSGARQLRQS